MFKKVKKRDKRKYHEYLRSKQWKFFRESALDFYGRNCGKCGSKSNLEVHHKTYKNIFHEEFKDVMILCDVCHKQIHKDKIHRNGKKSKYMRDPYYDTAPVTYYPKRAKQ